MRSPSAVAWTLAVAAGVGLWSDPVRAAPSRQVDPSADAVDALRARLPELDRTRRGRWPVVVPLLRDLGPSAVPALLDEIRHPGPRPAGIGDDAWSAWRAGLIEAAGTWKAPEAVPLLRAALADPHGDDLVLRAAAEALGRIADDGIAADLARLVRTPGPRQAAVIGGMGTCRRVACVEAVGAALGGGQLDVPAAKTAARALGRAGSAWAWQTPELAGRADGDAVGLAAARALIAAFVQHDGEVRQTAANALMVVGHHTTPALVGEATRGASRETARLLASLLVRFARDSQGR